MSEAFTPTGPDDFDHRWIASLKAKHRIVFECHILGAAEPLVRANAYIEALQNEHKVSPSDIQVVLTLHQSPAPLAFNDAAWAKYGFGERGGAAAIDPKTGVAATRNIFASEAEGDPYAKIAVPSLVRRGAIFLFCNNVMKNMQNSMARRTGATQEATRADLIASFLPGVTLVPAAVAATVVAQENGCAYKWLG